MYSIQRYLNKIIPIGELNIFKTLKENDKIVKNDIYEDNKNKIGKKEIIKKRNVGVDLIRIISMFGIVYIHAIYIGNAISKYNRYKRKILKSCAFIDWHNNAFSLISGIVSSKSTKYSNLLYLWLCVVFYSVGIHYYYLKNNKVSSVRGELYQDFYPAILGKYWYFSSYFGMYMFLPVVNKGIQYLNKSEFKLVVMSFLGIFVFWNSFFTMKTEHFILNRGYSPICLLYLYIIGAYIGKFNIQYIGIKRYIISFIYFFIFISLSSLYYQYRDCIITNFCENYKIKLRIFIKKLLYPNLNGVLKTTQAILITLLLLQFKYNEIISKIVTFFGHLTFGVYLIHSNVYVVKHYLKKIWNGESDNLTDKEVIQILFLKSFKLFLECIIIEYLRYKLFTILKIRQICIFIEKIVLKIVS